MNNLNFIPVLIFSQEVRRWLVAYIYLFIYDSNWDSGGEVAPNIYDNRLEFNSKYYVFTRNRTVGTFEVDTQCRQIFQNK